MRIAVPAAFCLVLFAAAPAFADAIDGAWCFQTERRMMINGPVIVTPAGTRTQGDYTRHAFAYVIPPSEPGAGGRVEMRLISEDEVKVRLATQENWETWRRCGPPVS